MEHGDSRRRTLVLGVSGWHNSGKTVLCEALVAALRGRGWRVAAVKHAAHGLELDRPGTDSTRLWEAGADAVVLVGPDQMAVRERLDGGDLDDALARVGAGYDLVLVEGFKDTWLPRVVLQMRGRKRLDESGAIAVVDVGEVGLRPGDDRLKELVECVVAWIESEQANRGYFV